MTSYRLWSWRKPDHSKLWNVTKTLGSQPICIKFEVVCPNCSWDIQERAIYDLQPLTLTLITHDTDHCHLHRYTYMYQVWSCLPKLFVRYYKLFSYIKVEGQGQRLKVTDNCHLHRYTCAKFEVVCPICSWDITRKSYFHVLTQGQRSKYKVKCHK